MATRNIFYWLIVVNVIILSVGCESLRVRHGDSPPGATQEQNEGPIESEEMTPAPAEPPAFLKKRQPRLGFVLSAGGALAYAHIGFLQELESQKIPVHSVGGLGWGALVAASYSREGKAHGVEWKLLKFPTEAFEKRGFFSSGRKMAEISDVEPFLKSTFTGQSVDKGAIPFACAYADLQSLRTRLSTLSLFEDRVKQCWPYPPHFQIHKVAAQPTAVDLVAQSLRAQGAEKVIYVDVITANSVKLGEDKITQLLWLQNKSQSFQKIDEIIQIALPNQDMGGFLAGRSLIRMGQLKSKNRVRELSQKYAY